MNKPFAVVLDASTSLCNKTGSWRTKRPEYITRLPPCNSACPAGENIQQWLYFAIEGKFFDAWKVMVERNPFPAVIGRVCYSMCEKACNRAITDGAVNINLLERSIGDLAIAKGWEFEKNANYPGKKILIIGAGPSGLSAAYFLKKLGHEVTIYDNHKKPGGMMRYGVPRYRLPNNVLDTEIKRIVNFGVKIICDKKIDDIRAAIKEFDAVYIAVGASIALKPDVKIESGSNIVDAVGLFQKLENEDKDLPYLGQTVLVCGGGNTAIDAARSSLRLGAKNVKIIYRRTIDDMPANENEIGEALAEGIEILCLRTISKVDKNKIFVDKMNYDREASILSKSGELEILYADSVIFAIGQSVDKDMFSNIEGINVSENGVIEVDENMMTEIPGVFAGGDAISGKRTVTHAIAWGKKASNYIDAYLRSTKVTKPPKNEVITFKRLNVAYYTKNPRKNVFIPMDISFKEKDTSYSGKKIIEEASRCFSCGNCFHCDNCYGYCPDGTIIKHKDGSLEFNYDYCKGCGICASECPCGAIKMIEE